MIMGLKRINWIGFLVFFVFCTILDTGSALDLSNCRKALGMQSYVIPDSALKASSSYDDASVGPANGRIRVERNGGAWCPKLQISRSAYEWLEIDLQDLKVITQVETQGRFGNGQGQEFADNYTLEYTRANGDNWNKFRDKRGNELLAGNVNTFVSEIRNISPPIIARKIRIVPYSSVPRTICMRVELYGCQWKDGVISYSMPQGERRGSDVDLQDVTYDGRVADTYLSGGLGQLTDGAEGHTNFRLDSDNSGKKGYEWVGWKNDTIDRPPIQIIFEFDRVRNFTAVRFHANNMFSKEVRVFRKAILYFGAGTGGYQERAVVFEFMRDTLIENARQVIVPVQHRIGRFIKCDLYFDAKWMMISEIRFDSDIVTGEFVEEPLIPDNEGPQYKPNRPISFDATPFDTEGDDYDDGAVGSSESGIGRGLNDDDIDTSSTPARPMNEQLVGIVIGAISMSLLLLLGVTVICIIRRRRSSARRKYAHCSTANTVIGAQNRSNQLAANLHTATAGHGVVGSQSGIGMNGGGEKVYNPLLYNNGISGCDIVGGGWGSGNPVGGVPSDTGVTFICRGGGEPWDEIQLRKLPEPPPINVGDNAEYLSDTNTSTYAVLDAVTTPTAPATLSVSNQPRSNTFKPFQGNAGRSVGGCVPPVPPLPHPRTVYGSGAIGLRACCGSSVFALPSSMEEVLWIGAGQGEEDVPVLPHESLNVVERLGHGPAGEINVCEMRYPSTDKSGSSLRLVIVKRWNKTADNNAISEFNRELLALRCLRDPNIVQLLGVCRSGTGTNASAVPLCIVTEYPRHGDLKQFLQRHVAQESSLARRRHANTLSYGCLIYLATQIASGMKHLETLGVVHRDLAARNCLVGENYEVKVTDIAMSRAMYSADYYHIDGTTTMLPVRWMAWESLLLGEFSPKSDVWSFAVTLWEILGFAHIQPYATATEEQLIENARRYYYSSAPAGDQGEVGDVSTSQPLTLPQFANCPKEIYDLMCECWNRDDAARPAFREIHMFLARKNMGYSPADELGSSSSLSGSSGGGRGSATMRGPASTSILAGGLTSGSATLGGVPFV